VNKVALGVPAAACLAIEDSETGFRAAHAAGIPAVLIPDLVVPGASLLALSPRVLQSLADVHRLLAAR